MVEIVEANADVGSHEIVVCRVTLAGKTLGFKPQRKLLQIGSEGVPGSGDA